MSVNPEFLKRLQRMGQELRGEIPKPAQPEDEDEFLLECEVLDRRPENFDAYRLWLYRLCIVLPKGFLCRFIDIAPTSTNPKSQERRDLTYSPEVVEIAKLCTEYSVLHPPSEWDADWTPAQVAGAFQHLLSNESRVTCFKNAFIAMIIKRDPTGRLARTIWLERAITGHCPVRTRRR